MAERILGVWVALSLIMPLSAHGGPALDTLQKRVNSVIEILRDSSLKGEAAKETKKKKIQAVTSEMFDFEELSRRTLAKNWNKLSPSQQNEFVQLYRELLENAYMDRILSYSNEKVLYVEEKMPEKGKAEVKTRMTSQTGEIPIDYWLIQMAGAWKVYDVVIERVSLTKNYRAQFRESLLKKSPAEMLQSLRKKVGKE